LFSFEITQGSLASKKRNRFINCISIEKIIAAMSVDFPAATFGIYYFKNE
jgi:uncharacterized membrane protein